MNKAIIILLMGIMLFSLSSAEIQTLSPQKQFSCVEIPQTCANCTAITVTAIKFPNSTFYYANAAMTQVNANYNYTFCHTDSAGSYIVTTCGDPDGAYSCVDYDFEVTPTGNLQTNSQGINSLGFLALMIVLTGIFGWVGFRFSESDYLWVVGILFIFLAMTMMVYDTWLGYEFHKNWTGINDGSAVPEIIFYIFMFILVAGFLTSLGLLFTKWKKVKRWFEQAKADEEEDMNEKDWM